MAIWVDGIAAPLTRGTTGRHDRVGLIAQRGSLAACEEDTHMAAIVDGLRIGLALLVDGDDFLELDQHPVIVAVVPEPDGPEDERRIHRLGQFHRRRQRLVGGRGQIAHHLAEIVGDSRGLLLLALHRYSSGAAAGLQQEDALTWLADSTDGERIDLVELVEDAHQDGLSSASDPPLELTVKTTGPPSE
ncbi:MAG: hypothetical protein QOH53_999 [Ilumatobacteraceae bacterium]